MGLSRRHLIRLLAISATVPLAAACGTSATPAPASVAPTSPPSAPPPTAAAAAPKPSAAAPSPAASPSPGASPSAAPAIQASPIASPSPVAAGSAYRPTPLNPTTTVSVGISATSSDAGLFVAIDRGYFTAEGLNVELQRFQSAAAMIPVLGTNQLDVGGGSSSAAFFNAVAQGVPIKLVADKGSITGPDWDYVGTMVRKDLIDSGRVKDFKDLKGLTISISGKGTGNEISIWKELQMGGLTFDDVNIVYLDTSSAITALTTKAIDIAHVAEPTLTQLAAAGTTVTWKGVYEVYGPDQVSPLMYSPKMIGQTDVARRFMIAYLRGVRDYNDAYGPRKQGLDDIVRVLVANTALQDAELYKRIRPPALNPNGQLIVESMQYDMDYYVRSGDSPKAVEIATLVDSSFADYAVQQLGPYPSA
jgi:NitT/TauT family transport system substrate-binding protein